MNQSDKTGFAKEQKTLMTNWDKYKGKIVAVSGGKVFAATTGKQAQKMIKDIEKKSGKSPLVTYIPKADTLILNNDSVPSLP